MYYIELCILFNKTSYDPKTLMFHYHYYNNLKDPNQLVCGILWHISNSTGQHLTFDKFNADEK